MKTIDKRLRDSGQMNKPRKDLTGNRFGKWQVLEFTGRDKGGRAKWLCECSCGAIKIVDQYHLTSGQSSSCLKCSKTKDGRKSHYLYNTWALIKDRIYNPQNVSYLKYGGNGIKMFDFWVENPFDFFNYVEKELGHRPIESYTIDRINNKKGYFPGNLRWASKKTQARNRSNNTLNEKMVSDIKGFRLRNPNVQISKIARKINVPYATVYNMLKEKSWKDVAPSLSHNLFLDINF